MGNKILVCCAGGFDPLRIGHTRHLKMARCALGDWLIVLVSNDEDMVRKKGFCFMPLEERMEILRDLWYVDEVIATIDKDGTQAETLRMVKPNIFAKGGDRTPDNMPQNEIEACQEIGCTIIYGVGEKITSSTEIVKNAVKKIASG